MPRINPHLENLEELIDQLDNDRAWLLQQIDSGRWPELQVELASLERELGQLLTKAAERLEGDNF
mgnify:CR=1 FL=1